MLAGSTSSVDMRTQQGPGRACACDSQHPSRDGFERGNARSICFVSQRAYNVLKSDSGTRHIGGAETQQALLARVLLSLGYPVSFVVFDHGQRDGETVEGIRLYKTYRPDAGLPGMRFFHPRLSGLWAALGRANAEIYYQRGAESETGLVANWCRRHHRKFVFAMAGHHMLVPNPPTRAAWREKALFRYGMNNADLVLVQSHDQKALLRDEYGLASKVLRNVASSPAADSFGAADHHREGVLWVGRYDAIKRFEWCLEVAEQLADVRFTVVGVANAATRRGELLLRRAERLPNVSLIGYVEPGKIHRYYRSARVLLCTSVSEGFPNVFLEAWSCGTAVVSSVDPDGIIQEHRLGCAADSVAGLATGIAELRSNDVAWKDCSDRCRQYVMQNHTRERIGAQLHKYLTALGSVGQRAR